METQKITLSLEVKKQLASDLFELITNPDKGFHQRKCVMGDWYKVRPGLRNNEETLFFGLRENDGALCAFNKLPIGTESSEYFHAFDERPFLEICPLETVAGFEITMSNKKFHSSKTLLEIGALEEVIAIYKDFIEKYKGILQTTQK